MGLRATGRGSRTHKTEGNGRGGGTGPDAGEAETGTGRREEAGGREEAGEKHGVKGQGRRTGRKGEEGGERRR